MNKKIKALVVLSAAGAIPFMAGCASGPTRIQAGGPTAVTTMGVDLADFKNAAGEMISQMLVHPAIGGFEQVKGRRPLLNVGEIRNNSDISINLGQLAGRINEDLLNSGLVEIMANDAGVVDAVAEDEWASDKKRTSVQRADYLLEGQIMLLTARDGRTREKSYTFQLRLNDTKSRKTVWQRTVDIAKQGTRAAVGW